MIVRLKNILTWTLVFSIATAIFFLVPAKTLAQTSDLFFSVTASGDKDIKLTWNRAYESDGFAVYKIKRNGQIIGSSDVSTTSNNIYLDKNVPDGSYSYKVIGLDANGKQIAETATINITKSGSKITTNSTTPAEGDSDIFFKVVASGDKNIKLTWNRAYESDGFAVYKIKRNGQIIGSSDVSTIGDNSYLDQNVPDGTYNYQVIALDASGKQIAQTDIVNITKAGSAITTNSTTPTTTPSGDTCDQKCDKLGPSFWNPLAKFNPLSTNNLQKTICQVQCTVISWITSMVAWLIQNILFPALGLDVSQTNDQSITNPTSGGAH